MEGGASRGLQRPPVASTLRLLQVAFGLCPWPPLSSRAWSGSPSACPLPKWTEVARGGWEGSAQCRVVHRGSCRCPKRPLLAARPRPPPVGIVATRGPVPGQQRLLGMSVAVPCPRGGSGPGLGGASCWKGPGGFTAGPSCGQCQVLWCGVDVPSSSVPRPRAAAICCPHRAPGHRCLAASGWCKEEESHGRGAGGSGLRAAGGQGQAAPGPRPRRLPLSRAHACPALVPRIPL